MSFLSDNQQYHANLSVPARDVVCYMYWSHLDSVLPYYGPLSGSSDVMPFVEYTTVGLQPTLYPIYIRHRITLSAYLQTGFIHISVFEADQSTDVPIYTLVGALPSAIIDLPPRWTRQGHDTKTHIVYDCCAPSNCQTIIFWAENPLGYNMHTLQVSGPQDISDVYSSISPNDSLLLDSWVMSDLNTVSEGNSDVSAHESYSYHYSAHSVSQAENELHVSDELHHANDVHHAIDVPPPAPKNTASLKSIMIAYPKWRLVLAYLRLLMRVAILKGESENPHLITRTSLTTKNTFIADLFAQSLVRANTTSQELETVISTKDGKVISEREVLCLRPSIILGPALGSRLEFLLDHFLPPHSALLPIEQNGIVWFLRTKLAKALLWHVVFRVTRSNGVQVRSTPSVPLVVADLAPDTFKNAPSLLSHTLAFVESFCYAALVRLLKDVMEQLPNTTLVRAYPTPREIHNQGIETIDMLLQQHDDPGLASLQTYMLHLCKLAVDDVERVVRQLINSAPSCAMADDGDQILKSYKEANECFKNMAPKLSLSDSLFITTAVLFGLVDSHDLSGLLEVVFEEVKTQTPLQQEENCSAFLHKAIANLYEELNTRISWRFGPNSTLLAVNAIGHMGTCPPPHSLNFKCFGPTKATEKAAHDKCHAWLRVTSQSQDTTQVACNPSTPPKTFRHWESLLRRFTRKEYKSLDALMSIFHILDLKTQRAQAEADMFSEAIECTAEIEFTDDGMLVALFQFYNTKMIIVVAIYLPSRSWAAITFTIVSMFHEVQISGEVTKPYQGSEAAALKVLNIQHMRR
ncbi:hypothetical protein BD769DRAFT_1391407 [Suillus cothurnatus]|nr:hypothetical protein BD769DRAFT_1391407 [Suillus cothurnatus]